MTNDLISRQALREDLRKFFPAEVLEGIEPKTLFAQIMHDIDNAPTVDIPTELCKGCRFLKDCETCEEKLRPQGRIIYCKECKYQIKEFRSDKREKGGGHYVYACKRFGEMFGYWGWGGEDNEFCSDALKRGDTE